MGSSTRRTIQFVGSVADVAVTVLVDSGSSTSFLAASIADQLLQLQRTLVQATIKIANGQLLQCTAAIMGCQFSLGPYSFQHDLRVLSLDSYDLILGMDWLELYSPMEVHWQDKWLSIPYNGDTVLLQGITSSGDSEIVIQLLAMEVSANTAATTELPPDIAALLAEFPQVFTVPSALPPKHTCDHAIPLVNGATPVNIRAYRYPPSLKDEIECQVNTMLEQGLIQPSKSPFSSPVLLVRKKDGSWCFCVDYRYLNTMTMKSVYPIPIFEQLVDELDSASWFSILDLHSGYHQIRLKPSEEYKIAFSTHTGHFEFRVVPFGATGAPATFQGAMNSTLSPVLRRCALVFFDDILVYSSSYAEHLQHLHQVLTLLANDQWVVKLKKCSFAKQEIHYLGHILSAQGVQTDPEKVSAVMQWPTPANVRELRGFLGLAGFYRRFVRHFAILAKPLTQLLKKHQLFIWTTDHQKAFEALQQALCSAPVLAIPNFAKLFAIETDACQSSVGVVLLQEGHPLAYVSKPLGPKTQGLSIYEKEYMAILIAIEQWRSYL
jgi:hypothetical protein